MRSTVDTQSVADSGSQNTPLASQLARSRALRRFNWAFVYLPLLLATMIVLVLIAALLWTALAGQRLGALEPAGARGLASGLADLLFVLAALPWALLCPVLPLLLFAGIVHGRRQGTAPLRRLRELLWRLERQLQHFDRVVERRLPPVAAFVIRARATWTSLSVTVRRLVDRRAAPR